MKIRYTKHALNKFKILTEHGIKLTKNDIKKTINKSEDIDTNTDHPKLIASRTFDKKHVLRVVYKIEGGIIVIITFYPAEKERYY